MRVNIVGQGYVGLPLAQGAVEGGHEVVGLDLNPGRVERLNLGVSDIDDISDDEIRRMLDKGYSASSDPAVHATADVIVICVPTPLRDGREPDLGAVHGALRDIVSHVAPNTTVILESTTYPGTTATELAPALESAGFTIGQDLFLAFSPERIDPGNATYGIRNTPKVVGADDPVSRDRAVAFYSSFIDEIVPVSGSAEAELTKLLENTYRHINIGLVNELAVACHELGIDVWEVIRAAATKPFGFQSFTPGPGVGGHCIPIDPNYLSARVRKVLDRPFRFVELAEDINSSMPAYVVSRVQDLLNSRKKSLCGSHILLLGVTYKSGIADTRESPAARVANFLFAKGAEISFYDPIVTSWAPNRESELHRVPDVTASLASSDATILLQHLPGTDIEDLARRSDVFLDTRGVTRTPAAERL